MALDIGDQPLSLQTNTTNTYILGISGGTKAVIISPVTVSPTIYDLDGGEAVVGITPFMELDGGDANTTNVMEFDGGTA
jgi:hypothetical protein